MLHYSEIAPSRGADVILGQLINGKFVPQVFNGTQASAGESQSYSQVWSYNTAEEVVPGGVGIQKNYKCASVSSANKTWTGYQAHVDQNDIWTFSSQSTQGLQYQTLVPQVGSVYDSRVTYKIQEYSTGIPDDYALYVPMATDLSYYGTMTDKVQTQGLEYTQSSQSGKACLYFSSGRPVSFSFTQRVQNLSIAMWMKSSGDQWHNLCGINPTSTKYWIFGKGSSLTWFNGYGDDWWQDISGIFDNKWHFILFQHKGYQRFIYRDGVLLSSYQYGTRFDVTGETFTLFTGQNTSDYYVGKMAKVRVYFRTLSSRQKLDLYCQEF